MPRVVTRPHQTFYLFVNFNVLSSIFSGYKAFLSKFHLYTFFVKNNKTNLHLTFRLLSILAPGTHAPSAPPSPPPALFLIHIYHYDQFVSLLFKANFTVLDANWTFVRDCTDCYNFLCYGGKNRSLSSSSRKSATPHLSSNLLHFQEKLLNLMIQSIHKKNTFNILSHIQTLFHIYVNQRCTIIFGVLSLYVIFPQTYEDMFHCHNISKSR